MACIFLNHSPPGLQAHSRASSHLWVCALVSEGKEGVRMHMHPQCGVEVKGQLLGAVSLSTRVLRISLRLPGLISKHLYPWSMPAALPAFPVGAGALNASPQAPAADHTEPSQLQC